MFLELRPKPWNSISKPARQLSGQKPYVTSLGCFKLLQMEKRLLQSPCHCGYLINKISVQKHLKTTILDKSPSLLHATEVRIKWWLQPTRTAKPNNAHKPCLLNLILFWWHPHICQKVWFIHTFNFKTGLNIVINYYRVERNFLLPSAWSGVTKVKVLHSIYFSVAMLDWPSVPFSHRNW